MMVIRPISVEATPKTLLDNISAAQAVVQTADELYCTEGNDIFPTVFEMVNHRLRVIEHIAREVFKGNRPASDGLRTPVQG
ncbi:MAG: hypothetical protein OEY86_07130 [Nitrospira sp.]|nr:hypothetical protein [Nitrospira sp.]